MPLLRYAIGDYAEAGSPCTCGRGLPTLARILGRARDLRTLPSGERRFSLQASRALRDIPGIRQFQIVQRDHARLEIRLQVGPPFSETSEAEMRRAIRARTVGDLEIEFVYGGSIERSEDGLFREFLRAQS
jgi:phenylacetate-CoA ligase